MWFCIGVLKADKGLIEKFGDDYKHYMQKVPRMNFSLGLIRLLRRRSGKTNLGILLVDQLLKNDVQVKVVDSSRQ